MSIISYAQNFEDVILWRALKHVEKGFYIDIGAQDPVKDSVSLAFYEKGWRGIHVEPTRQYSQMLREARPDETVLEMAIGIGEMLSLFEFGNTGLSTGNAEIAQRHRDLGFECTETNVKVLSLDDLLDQVENQDVHWMKIDVEGLEKSVLQSWQLSLKRPWIVIVESTKPMTSEANHDQWENDILEKGYSFTYFDGLNRFYLSNEHNELIQKFSSPPNVFDGFFLSGLASSSFCKLVNDTLAEVEMQFQGAEANLNQAEAKLNQAEVKLDQTEVMLLSIYQSRSWRITAPLRKVVTMVYWFLSGAGAWIKLKPGSRPKRVAKFFILKVKIYIVARPKIKMRIISLLWRYPRLNNFYRKLVSNDFLINISRQDESSSAFSNTEINNLTPRARKIFLGLQQAIEKRKGFQ